MQMVRPPTRPPEMTDIPTFTTGADLLRHYRAVRRRMETARPKPVLLLSYTPPPPPEPQPPPRPLETDDMVEVGADDLGETEKVSRIEIMRAVGKAMNMPVRELQSARREQSIVRARFVFYAMAKHYTRASLPQIARTANRDHSTVLHGIRRASAMVDELWPHFVDACALLGLPYPKREFFVVTE